MTKLAPTPKITRALVRQPRYLQDFGRVEADVVLYVASPENSESRVKVVTSVPARRGEDFKALYLRLTQDAARLWRLLEAQNFPVQSDARAA